MKAAILMENKHYSQHFFQMKMMGVCLSFPLQEEIYQPKGG